VPRSTPIADIWCALSTPPPPCHDSQVKGLLEIVSAASEFDTLPLRPGEENVVQKMISHAPVAVDKPRFSDPHTKVNALLQAHFSRERLSGDLGNDTRTAVREAARLLQVGTGLTQQQSDARVWPVVWSSGVEDGVFDAEKQAAGSSYPLQHLRMQFKPAWNANLQIALSDYLICCLLLCLPPPCPPRPGCC